MGFGQFVSILRARWWVVLAMLVLAVGLTLAISLLLPRQYTATASLVVDFKPDPVSAAVSGGATPPAVMATQVDILNSERVALRVVRNLRLDQNATVREQWLEDTSGEGNLEQWLVALFEKRLEVRPSRDSGVLSVSYTAPDADFAATMANAFVKAYIETTLELRVNPARQYSGFFDAQVRELREALETAQARLSGFQREHGIVASDERLDVETARLNELNSQLVALQALAAESRSREKEAGRTPDRMQEVLNHPLIGALKADIGRTEARLQELDARLGDAHPQVVETRANLASLRQKLEVETRRVGSGVVVTSNINAQREAEVRASLDAQRSKVLRSKSLRDQMVVLQRDVESAQRAYDMVQARLAQSSLESQSQQSNVNQLTLATPPVKPSSPRILLNTLVAVFLGLLAAIGSALLLELADRRVRTLDDVVATLGLPVLGVMPRPPARRWLRGPAMTPMKQRLLAAAAREP